MTTRKNQNSILVLATLGVYLGLVLVGATPQILAQAAMTKQFNVKDEIEVKDDLDKKPKDLPLRDRSIALDDFAFAYSDYYLEEYKNEVRISQETTANCPNGCVLHRLFYFPTFRPDLERILGTSNYFTEKSWAGGTWVTKMEIDFSPSRGELNCLQNSFVAPLEREPRLWTTATRLIREKSEIAVNPKNLHLVVTTRLARGSLDSLLAANAK